MVPSAIRAAPVPFPAKLPRQFDAALLRMPPDQGADELDIVCGHHPIAASQKVRRGGIGLTLYHAAEHNRRDLKSPMVTSPACYYWLQHDFAGTLLHPPYGRTFKLSHPSWRHWTIHSGCVTSIHQPARSEPKGVRKAQALETLQDE